MGTVVGGPKKMVKKVKEGILKGRKETVQRRKSTLQVRGWGDLDRESLRKSRD